VIEPIKPNPQAGIKFAWGSVVFAIAFALFALALGLLSGLFPKLVAMVCFVVAAYFASRAHRLFQAPHRASVGINFNRSGFEIARGDMAGAMPENLAWGDVVEFKKVRGRGDWSLVLRLSHKAAVRLGRLPETMRSDAIDLLQKRKLMINDHAMEPAIDEVLERLVASAELACMSVRASKKRDRFVLSNERSDNDLSG